MVLHENVPSTIIADMAVNVLRETKLFLHHGALEAGYQTHKCRKLIFSFARARLFISFHESKY